MKKLLADLKLLFFGLLPYVKFVYFIVSLGLFLCLLPLSIEDGGWYEFLFGASVVNFLVSLIIVKELANED